MDESILEKIYRSGLKLLAPLNSDETYSTIVQEAIKLVGAEYGSILLEQDGELKRIYSSYTPLSQTPPRKRANTYTAFTKHKTIIAGISNMARAHPELKRLGIKSTVFFPLSYHGKAIGVLVVNSKNEQKF